MRLHHIKARQVRTGDTIFPGQKHEDRVARVDVREERSGHLKSQVVRLYNRENVLIVKYNSGSTVTVGR